MEETKHNLSECQEQADHLKAQKARVDAHEAVKERAYNELVSRISSHKKAIEKNVHSALGQKVQIL